MLKSLPYSTYFSPRNLVLLVASLTFCGHTELSLVASSSSLYQLPDFQMPLPENRGATVRNLQAFQVPSDPDFLF